MNIKEIALKIWPEVCKSASVGESMAVKFAEALIAEVQRKNVAMDWKITFKGGNEPDGFKTVHYHGTNAIADYRQIDPDAISESLFTFPPSLEAEREKVAEACAKYLHDLHERSAKHHSYYLCAAIEIEDGEWRRFEK